MKNSVDLLICPDTRTCLLSVLKKEPFTKANGSMENVVELESKSGMMDRFTKGTGTTTKPTGMAVSSMLMEMLTKVNG